MLKGNFRLLENDFVLGAPIYVHFEYSNNGSQTIAFVIGNGKDDGFRFVASSSGVRQLNPYYELGGLAKVITLGPGMKGSMAILLNRYIQFIEPGKYQIRCEFDAEIKDELLTGHIAREEIRDTFYLNVYEDRERLNMVIAEIERDIREGDISAQLRGMEALSELRIEIAILILTHTLGSRNEALVEMAIAGLGNLGGKEAAEALRGFIASSTSVSLQKKALQELQKISLDSDS
jgi:hypothetical protein